MKILQINKYFYRKGGADVVFFNTIDILKKNGHTVIPFSTRNPKNEEEENDFFIDYPELSTSGIWKKLKYSFYFFYNLQARKNLKRLIKKEKPDIAHIHLFFNSLSISILPVLKKYGIPVVFTAHDHRLICPSYLLLDRKLHTCERCKNGSYYQCVVRRCSKGHFIESLFLALEMYLRKYLFPIEKYTDCIICVSNFSAAKHKEFKPSWSSLIRRVYNPIPLADKVEINRGAYLLYIGRISREKGIVALLKAAAALPGVTIKIVGTGEYKKELMEIPTNVTFLGQKNREELATLIKNASFAVFPSECYETFGLVVVEAFAHGTPVIASNIGGVSELVDNNVNGILFEAGDLPALIAAIEKVQNINNDKYLKMSHNALKKSEAFTPDKYYEQLIEIYNECLSKKKKNE